MTSSNCYLGTCNAFGNQPLAHSIEDNGPQVLTDQPSHLPQPKGSPRFDAQRRMNRQLALPDEDQWLKDQCLRVEWLDLPLQSTMGREQKDLTLASWVEWPY